MKQANREELELRWHRLSKRKKKIAPILFRLEWWTVNQRPTKSPSTDFNSDRRRGLYLQRPSLLSQWSLTT